MDEEVIKSPTSNLDQFLITLEKCIINTNCKISTYIFGDLNINLLINDNRTERYVNFMAMNYFYCCNARIVTRNISQTCIDHIFTNNLTDKIEISHAEIDLLDHNVMLVEIFEHKIHTSLVSPINNENKITIINNKAVYNSLLRNPIIIDNVKSCDVVLTDFVHEIQCRVVKASSLKSMKSKNEKLWLDSELIIALETKQFWYSKWIKDKTNTNLERQYKYFRNRFTSLKRNKRYNFYIYKFTLNQESLSKTYGCINEILYGNNRQKNNVDLLKGLTDSQAVKKINELNRHFANMCKILAKKYCDKLYTPSKTRSTYEFQLITESQVFNTIKSLNNSNSVDSLNMSTNMLKAYLLKISRVVPIFKSGNKDDLNNYRPICIATVLSKVMEKIVNGQLSSFLERLGLLSKRQHGFKKKSSTESALVDMLSYVQKFKDNKRMVAIVFLDLTKAFDTVDYDILLKKLHSFGIRGASHKWFHSYLNSRIQFCQIGTTKSQNESISYVVLQGSVLAPLLFSIYMEGIDQVGINAEIFLFADDLCLVFNDINYYSLEKKINENLAKLEHTEFIHSQNRILLVQDFIKYKLTLYIHDISNGELHSTTQLTTRSDHHEINTRSKQQIHLAKKNTTKFGTSTSIYKAIKLYNEIPENMKTLDNYKLKKNLRETYINNYSRVSIN
ncbi:uncharacterized protein LOC129608816 [Condylostylus longicornis]|uniref:uncharacterized protein LOC129608816 n=1 Tax=Condylostylus longicornis TaxID=2530218 RepID=UPI00244DD232|nr:uncharacterized protein LOC129608816 [Condylostylus longicornis]